MKRFLIFLMLAALLAACAPAATPTTAPDDNDNEATDAPEATEAPDDEEATEAPDNEEEATDAPEPTDAAADVSGTIVVWGWTAALRDTIEASGVLADFQEAYPDVEVEIVEYAPADVYTNLPLAISAQSEVPDVSLVENSHLAEYVHNGYLTAITEQVEPYIDSMNDYKWSDCTLDGEYYCMPWDSGPVVLYYRRDVFEAAGLPTDPEEVNDLLATWDSYLDACRTIKEETGAFCFSNNKGSNYARLYEMALWEQGLGYYDVESGDVTVDSAENIATLEMFGTFWEEELVSDNLEWTDPWYAELAAPAEESPIATIVIASWMEVFLKSWIAPGTSGNWGAVEMPSMGSGTRAANDGGSTFVIPMGAQNPEAAWAFIEFVLGREESQLKMFETSGFIPSLETTYSDDLFNEGDDFFAGQNTRQLYADVVQRIPTVGIYGPNYSMMNSAVALAIQRFAAGEVSAEEALQDAAEEIRANLE